MVKLIDLISKIFRCVCPLELAIWLLKRNSPWDIRGSFIGEDKRVIFSTIKGYRLGNTGIWFMFDRELDIKFRISELEDKLAEERKKLKSVMDKKEDDDDYY